MTHPPAPRKRWPAIVILLCVAAAAVALYLALRGSGAMEILSSPQQLRAWVAGFGPAAPAVFFALQVAQVVFSPIPGNVTTLAGGALFGFWPAFWLSYAAVTAGSLLAFGLGKWFGRPLVVRLAGAAVVERYVDALAHRQKLLLALFFLLPFFPDDALCLVAGMTGLGWGYFTAALVLARPWGLLFSAMVGAGLLQLPVWAWVILAGVSVALLTLSARYGPRLEECMLARLRRPGKENHE